MPLWKRGDAPIVGIKVHHRTSPRGIVADVAAVIQNSLPRDYVEDSNGKPVPNIFVIMALESSCRLSANPWHNYPTQREVVETILADTGVHVYLEGYQDPPTRDLFGQWGQQ